MQKFALLVLFCSAMFCLSGCVVSLPVETLSRSIDRPELVKHVEFLCQPALKGRKAQSWEAATVREYIGARFDRYGLKPWPGEDGYEQEFIFGTHMIGVMEGSDPDLVDEIVILSAHYDHIGTGRKGIYPGASDNAAGVAVLLEIAERMAMADKKPRRTVAFASFDAEEKSAFGAFAFTGR
jgi:acetylornithine deacetylase/succinyl-diaminopimelate desuccinylase-like protein